jgi:hypothetical protein
VDKQSVWYSNLRLGTVGFLVAATGAGLAFSINYGPDNPWSYLAVAIGVIGIGIGFFSVARGWWWMLTRRRSQK